MDPEGILNAWTTKVRINRASMMAITRASIFSRSLPFAGRDEGAASWLDSFFKSFFYLVAFHSRSAGRFDVHLRTSRRNPGPSIFNQFCMPDKSVPGPRSEARHDATECRAPCSQTAYGAVRQRLFTWPSRQLSATTTYHKTGRIPSL